VAAVINHISFNIPLRRLRLIGLLLVIGCSSAANAEAIDDATLQSQRALFSQTRELLQRKQTATAAAGLSALQNYPLYPYLQLLQLQNTLDVQNNEAIDAFLTRYEGAVVADQLRTQWLQMLATNERWSDYLNYFRSADASKIQQCWYLEALYRTNQNDMALQETNKLWLTLDLPDECAAPLQRWLDSNQRAEPLVWKKLLVALERKQEALARSLVVQMRAPYKLQAEYALLLYRDPTALNDLLPQIAQQPEASGVIALALKTLARRDPLNATQLWQQIKNAGPLTAADSDAVRKEIGRWQVAQLSFDALPWLQQFDPNGEDGYLAEWRARLALRGGDWPQIEHFIAQLPSELTQTSRWQYWRARALAAQTDNGEKQKQAQEIFNLLARERSYYGFLAADWLKSPYQFNDQRTAASIAPDTLLQQPAIARAREFYLLGENANARREWLYASRQLSAAEKSSAALLAEQWGWYDQTIRAANQIGIVNDLRLRFPVGFRDDMHQAAQTTALPLPWLFAITRQESAFMPDARSPVGALGLMQLMPDTARQVAKGQRMRINTDQLLQPEINIRLGSNYLRELFDRYTGNRVLATAAYNAGPSRISTLLKNQDETLPVDVWIEILPYRETREYVQNVLAFAVIYGQRLGQPIRLLNATEQQITGNAPSPIINGGNNYSAAR